ncbi:hypothetical protein [Polystyrenella longa]|nr:hypothetical protein [Polystyrenella longa]
MAAMAAINWCELYVDSKLSCNNLADLVMTQLEGKLVYTNGYSFWDIDSLVGNFSVELNENRPNSKTAIFPEFLFYPIIIGAEQTTDAHKEEYQEQIKKLVEVIRTNGNEVAVIADFME